MRESGYDDYKKLERVKEETQVIFGLPLVLSMDKWQTKYDLCVLLHPFQFLVVVITRFSHILNKKETVNCMSGHDCFDRCISCATRLFKRSVSD